VHQQLPWSISSACANLAEASLWSSEKVDLGGSKLTCTTLLLMDQRSPKFFAERGRNRCRHSFFRILDISIRSTDSRGRSLKLSEITPNFARFWPSDLFDGWPQNFQTFIIKLNIIQSRGNVALRSAEGDRRSRGKKRKEKKHQR